MRDDDTQPPEAGGTYGVEQYEKLPCEFCGSVRKTLIAGVSENGHAFTIIRCDECGLGNKWTGEVRQGCL